jgi:hypothetical protein
MTVSLTPALFPRARGIRSALRRTDMLRFLDISFCAGGLFKGDRIIDTSGRWWEST